MRQDIYIYIYIGIIRETRSLALTTCVYPTRSSSSMAHHLVRMVADPVLVHRVPVA